MVSVWDFQGAVAPDREVLRVSQAELAERFDDLFARLNPKAAATARRIKIGRLEERRSQKEVDEAGQWTAFGRRARGCPGPRLR
jgi:hypothetical protein